MVWEAEYTSVFVGVRSVDFSPADVTPQIDRFLGQKSEINYYFFDFSR